EANVEEALRLVVHSADVRIAVHPSQQQMLEEVLPRIQAAWPQLKHVELIADGTLTPGGCRVFSGGGGQIDGDLNLQLERIARGDRIENLSAAPRIWCSDQLLGRVLNGLGQPIDGKGPLVLSESRRIDNKAVAAMDRTNIREPVATGLRAVDGLHTCGMGQRM